MNHIGIDQLGINTVHYRYFTFESFLECQRKTGIRKIELFGAPPHCWIDTYGSDDPVRLKEIAAMHGMSISAFMIETSSMRYTLGSEGIWLERSETYFERCFLYAKALGVPYAVIRSNGFLLNRRAEDRCKRFDRMLRRLLETAEGCGMGIVLMPQFEDKTSMIRSLKDMLFWLEHYPDAGLYAGADIASVYEGGSNIETWLSALGNKLRHIHLSSTVFDGNRRCFGDGYLNGSEIMQILDEHAFTGVITLYHDLRKYWTDPLSADLKAVSALGLQETGK